MRWGRLYKDEKYATILNSDGRLELFDESLYIWPTNKDLRTSALCGHQIKSRGPAKNNER